MHSSQISQKVLDANLMRRGRRHAFESITPQRTAHIVIDLQNGFMQVGAPIEVPTARAIIPNVNRISRAMRAAGGSNVFLRYTHDPDEQTRWTVSQEMVSGSFGASVRSAFTAKSHFWQLHDSLDLEPSDLTIDKTRFSAFIPGTCRLHEVLKEKEIDTIVISGTLTNCCCESTARDAMQMNYRVIFISDATAALSDAVHNATLDNVAALFADVRSADEVVELIGNAANFENT
jgi:ureidoacrylate peracid hydrolase